MLPVKLGDALTYDQIEATSNENDYDALASPKLGLE